MRRAILVGRHAANPAFARGAFAPFVLGSALDAVASCRSSAVSSLGFWIVVLGVALGAWVATFEILDWLFFARLGSTGVSGLDGFISAMVVGLFALATWLRAATLSHQAPAAAVAVEVAGVALLSVKGWIGRELSRDIGASRPCP
ncbi:MAG: DUF2231 domain-containing protein [Polyangiaceae bacterium]